MLNRIQGEDRGTDTAIPPRTERERRPAELDQEWHGLIRAWRALGMRLPRLRVEASRYIAARVDQVKSKVSRTAEGALVGAVAGVVGIAVLATAAVLLITGIAGALAHALDGNVWAGNLLTGFGILLLLGAGLVLMIGKKRAARLKRLEQRYAEFDRASAMPGEPVPPASDRAAPAADGAAS